MKVIYTFGDKRETITMNTDILPKRNEVLAFENNKVGFDHYKVFTINRFIEVESNYEYVKIHMI